MSLQDFYYEEKGGKITVTGLKNENVRVLRIPEGVSILGKECFAENENIVEVHIPASVEVIGNSAFWLCVNLERVIFTDDSHLHTIEEYAFCTCTSMRGIELPKGLTFIDCYAFAGCESLKEITIPLRVSVVKACIFEDCYDLEKITVEASSIPAGWHIYWNEGGVDVEHLNGATPPPPAPPPAPAPKIKSTKKSTAKSPSAVTKKGTGSKTVAPSPAPIKNETPLDLFVLEKQDTGFKIIGFKNPSEDVRELIIPSQVSAIGYDAFAENLSIRSVVGHEGLRIIQPRAFKGCLSLRSVKLAPGTAILEDVFYGCSELEEAYIDSYAYENSFRCSGIKRVTVDPGVTSINHGTFYNCTKLEEIYLPDSVTYISDEAFRFCTRLKSVRFSPNIAYIEPRAFSCTSVEEVVLPEELTWLMESAFAGCDKLRSVTLNKKLSRIRSGTFMDCYSLKSLRIPKNIVYIEGSALDFRHLQELIIEKSPTSPNMVPSSWSDDVKREIRLSRVKVTFVNA
ncbi:MAG: leucine-rich repeat domain-containing protein [Clostridia bacterium]|nr:leucine-rich repeat domain-containing protein [Clostridia bacterium]